MPLSSKSQGRSSKFPSDRVFRAQQVSSQYHHVCVGNVPTNRFHFRTVFEGGGFGDAADGPSRRGCCARQLARQPGPQFHLRIRQFGHQFNRESAVESDGTCPSDRVLPCAPAAIGHLPDESDVHAATSQLPAAAQSARFELEPERFLGLFHRVRCYPAEW